MARMGMFALRFSGGWNEIAQQGSFPHSQVYFPLFYTIAGSNCRLASYPTVGLCSSIGGIMLGEPRLCRGGVQFRGAFR